MTTSSLLNVGGKILGAIDGSPHAASVCDHAAFAAARLGAPLEFVHVLDRHPERAPAVDLSGSLSLGANESLLQELAGLDERRGRLAQDRGAALLEEAKRRATAAGATQVEGRMRHGALVETLTELEEGVRLFVIGKRGEHAAGAKGHLGSNLERVVRSVHRPLLVVSQPLKQPFERFLFAFDGSSTARKGIEVVASSPLFSGLEVHVVTAGSESEAARAQLEWAQGVLTTAGLRVHTELAPGEPESVIRQSLAARSIDLLVMGAYGHSRIRQLIVGSTTTSLLRTCELPVLLLR